MGFRWRYAVPMALAVLLLMELFSAGAVFVLRGRDALAHAPLVDVGALSDKRTRTTRLADAVYGEYFVFDPVLGVRYRPGSRAYGMGFDEAANAMRYRKELGLRVDAQGYIANTDTPETTPRDLGALADAPDVLRILVSGGSTVAGWGASRNSTTWPARLEQALNARLAGGQGPWKRAVVINSGVFGYNIAQELHRFEDETCFLAPHIVICFDGINEQQGYIGDPVRFGFGQAQLRLMQGAGATDRPVVMPFTQQAMSLFAPQREATTYGYRAAGNVKRNDATLFLEKTRQFERVATLAGAHFLFLLQPILGVGERKLTPLEERMRAAYFTTAEQEEEYLRKMRGFYERVGKELNESWQVNLSGLFDTVADTVYADPRHYNDNGQQRIADTVLTLLKDRAWLP